MGHGHATGGKVSRTYVSWAGMVQRCTDPKKDKFRHYGGRGITVCERWQHSFENFLADMGERPAGTTLDRRDNNGNYEPENCRWATWKEQMGNRRSNRLITFKAVTATINEWAEITGLNRRTLGNRIKAGWPIERALKERAPLWA